MNSNSESVEKIWESFLEVHPNNKIKIMPEAFYFCDNEKDANECAELVVQGIKQATATSLWWFEKHQEPIPKIGNQYIVTDWLGNAKAIIETTKIEFVPFNEVTATFAAIEGEGDKSLSYWKTAHEAYYKREMEPHGANFDEKMIIVCEYFKSLYVSDNS